MAAFRSVYADLQELRTLAPSIRMMALTATTTKETKQTIIDVLRMTNVYEVAESPNKDNITYVVNYMPNDSDVQDYFSWIIQEIKEGKTEKTIVYCQTIKQCSIIYSTLRAMLGQDMFKGNSRYPVLEMLHSCTPDANKETVLESFRKEDGQGLVLVATIAFGMGVDCKGVHRTVHFGPSKNVEAFIQETGRAGRDGKPSFSYLLYKGLQLNHVEKDIKEFLKTKECRRKHFGSEHFSISDPLHTCCDNCASKCNCNSEGCAEYTSLVVGDKAASASTQNKRHVNESQREEVEKALMRYRKSLVMNLIGKSPHGQVKSLTNVNTLLGFSELQIEQVVNSCETIFSLEDVLRCVEIWDMHHAKKIINVLAHVFKDIATNTEMAEDESDEEFDDDELLGEWAALAEDDELLNLLSVSMSLSEMDSTCHDQEPQKKWVDNNKKTWLLVYCQLSLLH